MNIVTPTSQTTRGDRPSPSSSMAVHFSSKSGEHYTPPAFLEYVYRVFDGVPDLDPCCENRAHPNVPARRLYTRDDNGLTLPWAGRVFLNPPYGRYIIDKWIRKLRAEWTRGEMIEVIALLPARPGSQWFAMLTADTDDAAICCLHRRLRFIGNKKNASFPSMAVYFGPRHDTFAAVFWDLGRLCVCPPRDWFINHDDEDDED